MYTKNVFRGLSTNSFDKSKHVYIANNKYDYTLIPYIIKARLNVIFLGIKSSYVKPDLCRGNIKMKDNEISILKVPNSTGIIMLSAISFSRCFDK